MPAGRYRSRTLRRVFTRTPKGKSTLRYKKRKPSKAHCASCGGILTGVVRCRASYLHAIPKSKKRPQRPYGGMLCSTCTRRLIVCTSRLKDSSA